MSEALDRVAVGDCVEILRTVESGLFDCCVTSPPYWALRDYGVDGQIGIENTPDEYVARLVEVFREVRRTLRDDGTLWLNIGDTYACGGNGGGGKFMRERKDGAWKPRQNRKGFRANPPGVKPKDLIGIPWMLAFALRADGWWLRSEIIWAKPNPMPEGADDRPTRAHEQIFLLSKSRRYFFDSNSIRTPLADKTLTTFGSVRRSKGTDSFGRVASDNWTRTVPERRPKLDVEGNQLGANKRTVWTVATQPFEGAHFATFPPKLIEPCILAGSRPSGVVLDPFMGSGTTAMVAENLGRHWFGCELNPKYAAMVDERASQRGLKFGRSASGAVT